MKIQIRRIVVNKLIQLLLKYPFKGSTRIEYVLKVIVPKPKRELIISAMNGINILINPTIDNGVEKTLYYTGTYELGTLTVMKYCLNINDVFVDIGANIGMMSLYASKLVGDGGLVYAFEPLSTTYSILQKNININKCSNVNIFNLALGNTVKKGRIYENLNNRGAATLKGIPGSNTGELVEINTLDNMIEKYNISKIRMIKIDVEGYELEVLQGATIIISTENAPIICVEYNRDHSVESKRNTKILDFILSLNNYSFFKLEKGKEYKARLKVIRKADDLPKNDNIFCLLPYHIKTLNPKLISWIH